jgi:hypothetical protein
MIRRTTPVFLALFALLACDSSGTEEAVGGSGNGDGSGGSAGTASGTGGSAGTPASGGATGETGGSAGAAGAAGAPVWTDMKCGDITAANHPPFEAIKRLATTNEEVRILVYGQSISEQEWWVQLKNWLKATYPNGNLVMEEHARGGCASQCLVGRDAWTVDGKTENRLPGDVFAWNPDLVLFHVYGHHLDYESILKGFRDGCAAFEDHESSTAHCTAEQVYPSYTAPEVLVQTDHRWAGNYPITCPANPSYDTWDCFMNEKWIPSLIEKYSYTKADVWHEWADYIESTGTDPVTLTKAANDVHLSAAGNELMFKTIAPHLCYKP